MKPPWSNQFDIGSHLLRIGDVIRPEGQLPLAAAAMMKTAYYLDDDMACDISDFETASASVKSAYIHVCEERITTCPSSSELGHAVTGCWMLDVCLDYFITSNPFIEELKTALQQLPALVDDVPTHVALIVDMFKHVLWRQFPSSNDALSSHAACGCDNCTQQWTDFESMSSRRLRRLEFLSTLEWVLGLESSTSPPELKKKRTESLCSQKVATSESLHQFYCLQHAATVDKFMLLVSQLPVQLRQSILSANFQYLLPHHSSTPEEIDAMLLQFKHMLLESPLGGPTYLQRPPVVITIAKSVVDGFTPVPIADKLLNDILDCIRSILPPSAPELKVHDLTTDVVERCSCLFLRKEVRKYVTVSSSTSSSNDNDRDNV